MRTLLLRAGSIGAALLCMAGGVAAADPLPVADVSQSAVSADGWQLSATLKNMTFNSVPNMADTSFTREAFVTGSAEARIDGNGSAPVNSGSLILGMQLGCQIDLSWGGTLGIGQSAIPFAPTVSLLLLPGWIANVGLGRIPLKGRVASINVHDVEIKVDACGGPASARFFATTLINSDTSQDSQTIYGDIIHI